MGATLVVLAFMRGLAGVLGFYAARGAAPLFTRLPLSVAVGLHGFAALLVCGAHQAGDRADSTGEYRDQGGAGLCDGYGVRDEAEGDQADHGECCQEAEKPYGDEDGFAVHGVSLML